MKHFKAAFTLIENKLERLPNFDIEKYIGNISKPLFWNWLGHISSIIIRHHFISRQTSKNIKSEIPNPISLFHWLDQNRLPSPPFMTDDAVNPYFALSKIDNAIHYAVVSLFSLGSKGWRNRGLREQRANQYERNEVSRLICYETNPGGALRRWQYKVSKMKNNLGYWWSPL